VLLAGAAGLAGLAPVLLATAGPAWAFVETVDIVGRSYSPKVSEIEIGDKVLWRNRSDEKHTVTSDSGDFDYTFGAKGAQEERRFQTAGTYTYHCEFHDGMTGTVVVKDPNAPPSPTTNTTAPKPTTTTAPPTTTTAPSTTTTAPSTTTSAPPRPPAEVTPPPAPTTAAAPPPTLATSSTTTAPTVTTTTTAPPTTTSAPAPPTTEQAAAPTTSAPAPPATEATRRDTESAAARPGGSGDGLDLGSAALISLLVAVGLFGAWTLIRVRPGRI
jgi:plastocyanin